MFFQKIILLSNKPTLTHLIDSYLTHCFLFLFLSFGQLEQIYVNSSQAYKATKTLKTKLDGLSWVRPMKLKKKVLHEHTKQL
jgi:hypothetical protein